jgi:serine incorporator 1
MGAYCTYLLISALSSDPSVCNELTSTNADAVQVTIGITISSLAVFLAGWNLSTSNALYGVSEEEEEGIAPVEMETVDEEDASGVVVQSEEQLSEEFVAKNRIFHLVMTFASVYLAMLVTNWGFEPNSSTVAKDTAFASESKWIKIVSQWLAFLLFIYTLLAPKIFPDRDFSR